MPKAIEFLKHARKMCEQKNCDECPVGKDGYLEEDCNFFNMLSIKTDEEIANLVGVVENWHQERRKK